MTLIEKIDHLINSTKNLFNMTEQEIAKLCTKNGLSYSFTRNWDSPYNVLINIKVTFKPEEESNKELLVCDITDNNYSRTNKDLDIRDYELAKEKINTYFKNKTVIPIIKAITKKKGIIVVISETYSVKFCNEHMETLEEFRSCCLASDSLTRALEWIKSYSKGCLECVHCAKSLTCHKNKILTKDNIIEGCPDFETDSLEEIGESND